MSIEQLATINWSETDGSDVEFVLEYTLKDGIKAHKNLWLKLVDSSEYHLNLFQRTLIKRVINNK